MVACTTPKESTNSSIEPEVEVRKEKVLTYRDTIIETDSTFEIGKACGVFFTPSDAELQRLKNEIGEEDFFTVMDDYGWYFSESTTFLEDRGVKTIMTTEKDVRFHLLNGSVKTFHPVDTAIDWSPILYDGKNTIDKIDLVNIKAGYEAVFK
ncbi:MAG: hypothetical protein A3D31_13910 [Candidatus Fluviicola riflensis]|nr:MAG: hypothetical protein CHH17_18345 [Candidatus Fluviicola riflensis]OGS78071.1 MAG: hypothetical protein A3D31_13910 [Candidatus Fluviicola riflensis]OGS85137.1 MAG: hypothetical protein A2724_10845 [Fluviicola sp. RIFCSPHIGHO2_01_FULL_43_53]